MKKSFFIILLTAVLSLGIAFEASAQVPSIPQKTKTKKSSNNVVWGTQYDWLSNGYITYNDIRYYDKGQIRVLRNSIYARHGRYFKDKRLSSYFYSQSWYRPYRNEVPASELNKYEKANIAFLKKYE